MQRIEGPPYPSWDNPNRRYSRRMFGFCMAALAVIVVVAAVCAAVNQLKPN
jgi:hypothetical protein